MRFIQSLLSAAVLIAGINAAPAAPCDHTGILGATGWQGPGTYRLKNAQTGTSVDLFQGKTNVVGWQTDSNSKNQQWIISLVSSSANTWAIINTATKAAVTSNGWNNPVTAKALDKNNPSQLWLIEQRGAGGNVVLHSAASTKDVLDLSYGNPANNIPIVVYGQSGRPNQEWALELLSRSTDQNTWSPSSGLTINVGL